MAGITLEQAEANLATWMAALDKLAVSQNYSISTSTGSRTLTRANLADAQKQVEYWDKQVKRLTRGGIRVRGATIVRG
jgi:hypothetical protein